MPFRHEVLFPLIALIGLALVSSALLAAGYHCVMFLLLEIKRRTLDDWRQKRLRVWFVTAAAFSSFVVFLIGWLTFTWRPVSTLDVSHAWDDATAGGIAFSPDNKLLALGSERGFVEFWELPSLKRADHHEVDLTGGVQFVEFSRDGARLTYGSSVDPRVRVIDVASGEQQAEVNIRSEYLTTLASSDDLLTVVSTSVNYRLETSLWDTTTGTQTYSFRTPHAGNGPVTHIDRRLFAYLRWHRTPEEVVRLGQGESTIALHRLPDGQHLVDGPTVGIKRSHFWPCFSQDGDWLCVQDIIWNHQTRESHQIPGDGMAFLPNGRLLVVRSGGGLESTFLPLRPGTPWLFRTPILRRLLISREWSRILIYDIETRRIVRSSPQQDGSVLAWISADGKRMATWAGASELKVWNIPQ